MKAGYNYLRKWQLCLIIILLLWIQSPTSIKAEEIYNYIIGSGAQLYRMEELLGYYQIYSPTFQKSRVNYQIEALNTTLAAENYNSINSNYVDYVVKLSELQNAREALNTYAEGETDPDILADIATQLATINAQINQYNENIGSAQISLAEARLQEDVAAFYSNYQSLLIAEAQASLKNDFLKKCYGLITTKEQQDYYLEYQGYLETVQRIQSIKYNRRMVSQVELDLTENKLLENKLAMNKNQATYDKTYTDILSETNLSTNSALAFFLSPGRKSYKIVELQDIFLYNNLTLKQLANYISSYQNYKSSNATKSQALLQQINLKLEDYYLQESILRSNIKAYVKDAITSYETAFYNNDLARSELSLKSRQLGIVQAKKAHKRASELELRQASYEKEAAEVKYYQSYYEIIVWQNILDNHIYGAKP